MTNQLRYNQTILMNRNNNYNTNIKIMIQIFKSNSSQPLDLSIDIIGRQLSSPSIIGKLQSGTIRFLSDLDSPHFYQAIARGKFMILGLNDRGYYTTRATSSVPATLSTGLPLIATKEFISQYCCLQSSYIHTHIIAQDTECDSIKAALTLTPHQYLLAKEEIKNCSTELWLHAQNVFQSLIIT